MGNPFDRSVLSASSDEKAKDSTDAKLNRDVPYDMGCRPGPTYVGLLESHQDCQLDEFYKYTVSMIHVDSTRSCI